MSEEINWVFLRSFVWPHEHLLFQAFMESNGIEVQMRDEMTVMVDPLLSNAIGGVKMYVDEKDYERAVDLMREFDVKSPEQDEEESD